MPEKEEKVELHFGSGPNLEYIRNVERLYKNGSKADVEYELERILMRSNLQKGDSVEIVVNIKRNNKEPSK